MDTYTDIASNIREVQYLLRQMRNEIDCCRKATLTVQTRLRELATALAEEESEKRHMAAQDDSVPLLDSDLVPGKTTLEATSVLQISSSFEPELNVTHMMVKVSSEVFLGNFSLFFLPQNIEAGRTADLRLGGIYCPQPVCENDSVGFTSTFVAKMAFVGSQCPTQPFKVVLIHLKPPAKPPDRFINMPQMLDSHMISKLPSTSHKYVILLHGLKGVFAIERSDFDLLRLVKSEHLNTWISSLHTEVLSIAFSSLNSLVKPKGVEKAIALEFGVPFSIFPRYLHLCISCVGENSLQTFFQSSDVRWTFITSHSILCRSNDVQINWSWFGKPFWLPTDDTGYFILWHKWLTKVGNLVLKCLDMADFTFLLKHDELIPFDFAHKINGRQRTPCLRASSGLEVFLIVLNPITRRLNLNSIYKHVMVHVLWFDGAHGDKLYVQVVIAPCPGALSNKKSAKKIHSDHDVAAIHGVLLHMLHFCRYLVVRHTDLKLENYLMTSNMVEDMLLEATDFGEPLFIEDVLVVAGRVGYFEVHSTNFDQPLNTVWPEEVRFKASAKFLFYDIIIIEAMTKGTSPSNFSVAFGTVGVSKTISKFTLKVHKWATETSPTDSQATNIYLKQFIWQGYHQKQNQLFFIVSYFLETEQSITMSSSISGGQYNYLQHQNGEIMRYLHNVAQLVIISSRDDLMPLRAYPENLSKPDTSYNYPSSSSYQYHFSKVAFDVPRIEDIFLENNKVFDGIHPPGDRAGGTLPSFHYVDASTVIVAGPQDTLSRVESLIKVSGVLGCQWGAKGTKLALHHVSSSSLNKDTLCIIENGVVVHLPGLFKEIDGREFNGVPCQEWIMVFDHLHVPFNFNQEVEGLREVAFAKSFIDTPKCRSGTCYSGTINGNGLKVCGNFTVLLSGAAWDYVLNHYDPTYDTGAWPIGRWLEKMLFERLLQDDTLVNNIVLVDLAFGESGFSYHVEKNGELVYAGGRINYRQLQCRALPLHMYICWEDQLLVQWGEHPPDAQTWKTIASIRHEFPTFDLEGKVAFERVSNVTVIRRATGTTRPTADNRRAQGGTSEPAVGVTSAPQGLQSAQQVQHKACSEGETISAGAIRALMCA